MVAFVLVGCVRAVSTGDTLAAVLAEKGEPASRLERGSMLVLTYPGEVIRLEGGVVVSQKAASADYVVKTAAPKPASGGKSERARGDAEWGTDFEAAIASARGTGRKVFVFFTGSDWCGWCKRLESEILDTSEFKSYAAGSLVLVKLDFPRQIPQSAELKEQNRRLAEKYRIRGYPTVIILNQDGRAVARLGYQEGGPSPFVQRLREL